MPAIAELPAASAVAATDEFAVSQSGIDRRATAAMVTTFATGSLLLVDATFTSNSDARRFATIGAALAAAAAGDTIQIGPGTYTEDLVVTDHYIKILGSGMPAYDSTSGRLVGGTIIRGKLTCNASIGLVVRDLGFDLYGVNSDGIEASASNGSSNTCTSALPRWVSMSRTTAALRRLSST